MRRPVWALHVFVIGLALHNLAMAELWHVGVRGRSLELVSAWKEVLLVVALVLAIRARGRLPFDRVLADWLALAFAAVVAVYALLPQDWLGGEATGRGIALGARHALLPVAAYFLGRSLALTAPELRRLGATILATAAFVAAFGLVDIYAIPLQWWRDSGAPGWFTHQLGFSYEGLSRLPENFVYNTGDERPTRRLVSTFLSPLASAYLLVVALLFAAAWAVCDRLRGGRLALWVGLVVLLGAGLLWTHSRSAYLALALGLAAMAAVWRTVSMRPRVLLALGAAGAVAVGAAFVQAYPHLGARTTFTPAELAIQRANAETEGGAGGGFADASTESHWESLREGVRAVLRDPQGLGLGNAGSSAARTDVEIAAGESTYTELGIQTGLLGGLLFVAWSLALLWRVLPRSAVVGAALVAALALGLQTDVLGVPWLVYVVWPLAGARVLFEARRDGPDRDDSVPTL